MQVQFTYLLFERNIFIPHVGNVFGASGMVFQEGQFPGSSPRKVPIITVRSQQNLRCL